MKEKKNSRHTLTNVSEKERLAEDITEEIAYPYVPLSDPVPSRWEIYRFQAPPRVFVDEAWLKIQSIAIPPFHAISESPEFIGRNDLAVRSTVIS